MTFFYSAGVLPESLLTCHQQETPLPSSYLPSEKLPLYVVWCDLTHWGPVTHICVSKLTIIGSDNALSPGRRQAIIWTNAGILLIRTLGTNFSEILGKIHSFSFKKLHLKMSSAKRLPFSLGLNELNAILYYIYFVCDPLTQIYHLGIRPS